MALDAAHTTHTPIPLGMYLHYTLTTFFPCGGPGGLRMECGLTSTTKKNFQKKFHFQKKFSKNKN